jgi:sugar (pentulose or hexulose) kinase
MAAEYVLALDLGSSGIRAVVVSGDWRIIGEAGRSYRTYHSAGNVERFAPADLRIRVLDCLASALHAASVAPESISRIAITAQRGGTAFADVQGNTLYVGPNTDVRAVFEGAAIDDSLVSEVYATTGHLPSMFMAPAKLHWWRQHHPEKARRIATISSLGGWAAHQLTGSFGETQSSLVEAGLADVTTGRPASALLAQLGVLLRELPTVFSEGAVIGTLDRSSASATGLPVGTPVALAGPDAQVTAVGAGSIRAGDNVVIAGWSAPVQRVTTVPTFDSARRTWVSRHALQGRWVAEANPGDTGRTLDTIRHMLGRGMTLQRFDRLAATAPDRDLPIVAVWGPRAMDMSRPGISIGGLIAPAPITYQGIDAGAIAHATLENIAFAVRECLALLDEVAGVSSASQPLALAGGMANSPVFAAILAAVVGRPVRRQSTRAAAIGAALVSALNAKDVEIAASHISSMATHVEPTPAEVRDATGRYERWLYVRGKLDELAEEL